MGPADLTAEELAERVGVSVGRIDRLVELGILEPTVGRFPRRDVLRARVVEHLAARGIAPEDVARGLASGELTLGYLEAVGRRPPRSDRTFEELSAETGLPFSTLQRMYVAFGFPAPHPDERIREAIRPRHEGDRKAC